jgi:UDP-N-acetyl-2-amino-2-deoxyglucuronate dehydrogenase
MTTAAVIGCGDVSAVHLQAIRDLDGIDLVAVGDPDPGRLAETSERYGVPGYAGHAELLASTRPDVVHICTPHHQHVPIALDCLDAGVNVLLEKPVAHTVTEAERLIAAAETHPGVKTGICLQNRYNATAQAARTLLASGDLGRIVGGSATLLWHRDKDYYDRRPWRGQLRTSGGGVLINQAIHTLDLLEWLLGEVTLVHGRTDRIAPPTVGPGLGRGTARVVEVEDTAYALLDHAGGARSVFFATVAHVIDAPVTIEIVTEKATLHLRGDLTVTYPDGRTETFAEPRPGGAGRAYWGASHELLIADFHRSLADPEPFWIGPREATSSLRLIHEIYRQDS